MMSFKHHRFVAVCSISLLAGVGAAFGKAHGFKHLRGHVPELPGGLAPNGQLPLNHELHLAIGLPLRDREGLDTFLAQVYDPASTNFHRFLSPDEFTSRFGPTPEDYQAVLDFARTNRLVVSGTYANRLLLDVNGSAEDVQRAFHITLHTYEHPRQNRDFFAPNVEPSVDAQLPIADISGLNNFVLPHPQLRQIDPTAPSPGPRTGSSPTGSYMGKDFRAAYLPGVNLTGTGQMVGLLQFDGFYQSDITAYEATAGLPNVPVQTVLLDGYNGPAG